MRKFSDREILLFALIITGMILPIIFFAINKYELLLLTFPLYYLILIVAFLSIWVFLNRIRSMKKLDRLKSIFLASMSHELKTPLTSILGFTRMMLKNRDGELNKEQEKQLKIILNSANHLHELINDAIDVNKIEADKLEIKLGKFNLVEELSNLMETFNISIKNKELELLIDTPKLLIIFDDKKRIIQILGNLIGNAIKFTEEGKILTTVKKSEGTIEISVKDTGPGIRKEDLDKLFKPFSRIEDPGKVKEGTGLGLYLSKKLAHLLGGDLVVESEYGKGSCFTLILKSNDV
jgi:signal transduction histidine kinase